MAVGQQLDDAMQQDVVRRLQAGEDQAQIAQDLNISWSLVQQQAKRLKAEAAGNGQRPEPTTPPNGHDREPHTGTWTPDQPALQPHPLADLFPPLAESDLAALTADIRERGLLEPIWLYEGKILDGRNRIQACEALGIACPTREYPGDDPLAFALSLNLVRRHLSESQRAMIAAKIANMRQGRPGEKAANLPDYQVSQSHAAEMLRISERTLRDAKKVQLEAQPQLVKAVETGTIAVSAAARLANEPVAVQRAVVKKLETGEAKTFKAAFREVQGVSDVSPPIQTGNPWVKCLTTVRGELRLLLESFDLHGGMATVMEAWSPEDRQMFDWWLEVLEVEYQRLRQALQAVRETVKLTEAEDTPAGRADG